MLTKYIEKDGQQSENNVTLQQDDAPPHYA